MHDSVTARFGGRDLAFKIDRQDLPLFEAYSGLPVIDVFMRITGGKWTVENLKAVLKFASVPAASLKQLRQFSRTLRHMSPTDSGFLDHYFKGCAPLVNGTLSREPVAQYALLAQAILAGALFGITAADATFSDGTPDGE